MADEADHKAIEKAAVCDTRLSFSTGSKETCAREEIVELLGKSALSKSQEH